jgi:hypothetical protein
MQYAQRNKKIFWEGIKMKRRSWMLWVVLILVAFTFMSGGCGGGSGRSGGGDEPVNDFTADDVDDANAVLEELNESVFVENGEKIESLDFDTYVDRTVSHLESQPGVSNVAFYRGASITDSKIDVTFESGVVETIMFYDELLYPSIETDVDDSQLNQGNEGAAVSSQALNPGKDKNVLVLDYIAEEDLDKVLASMIDSKYGKTVGVDYRDLGYSRDPLAPLRYMSGYNYIVISAHGYNENGVSEFAVPYYGGTLSDVNLNDFNYLRIGLGLLNPVNSETSKVNNESRNSMQVFPKFFSDYYAGDLKLKPYPIVFLRACLLVKGQNPNESLIGAALRSVGAGATLGFDKSVESLFGFVNAYGIFEKLMEQNVVADAINNAQIKYGKTDMDINTYADDLRVYLAKYMSTQDINKMIAEAANEGAALKNHGGDDAALTSGTGGGVFGNKSGHWVATSGSGSGTSEGVPFTATLVHYEVELEFLYQIDNTIAVNYGPLSASFNVSAQGYSEVFSFSSPSSTFVPIVQIAPNKVGIKMGDDVLTVTFLSDTEATATGSHTQASGTLNFTLNLRKN